MLDLEARSAQQPRMLFDVTVRHSVPGPADALATAANHAGAVNRDAEKDKRQRYADGRTPWKVVPLAHETFGRLGLAALRHLRGLVKAEAAKVGEGAEEATSALVLRWGCRLSTALQRSNCRLLRSALGVETGTRACVLAATLAA